MNDNDKNNTRKCTFTVDTTAQNDPQKGNELVDTYNVLSYTRHSIPYLNDVIK